MNALVLLSGGIDSITLIKYYLLKQFKVSALFVDYNQKQIIEEAAAAEAICCFFGITLKHTSISWNGVSDGYIRARNLMLLSAALFHFEHESGIISIGIHSGTAYPDCSQLFVESMQNVFDIYESGKVQIDAPFCSWTKSQIYDFALSNQVPVKLAYSSNKSDLYPVLK